MENNTCVNVSRGELDRKQFKILTYLEKHAGAQTQREIAAATGLSLGSVNKLLAEQKLIEKNELTEAGYAELEP